MATDIVLRPKATADSTDLQPIPDSIEKLNADYQVDSLDGSGMYWHVSDLFIEPFRFLIGYIHESEVAAVEGAAVRFSASAKEEE